MVVKKLNIEINFIELKLRTIYYFYSISLTFIICFYYKIELLFLISNIFLNYESGFIYTNLLDPLIIYIKLSLLFTFIITYPIIGYLYGFFFLRSFYSFYLHYFIFYWFLLYILSFLLFIIMSKVVFFRILEFLISFQKLDILDSFELVLKATMTQYYSFFFNYLLIYIILILIPNCYLLLIFSGIISKENFESHQFRKYLYLVVLSIFLLIAPPDFFLQLFILPFIIIFLELYIYIMTYLYSLYYSFISIEERRNRTFDK